MAAMIMRTAPEPSTDEGKRVHQELRDLLETAVGQQAPSSMKRRHPKVSFIHISSAHSGPDGHHTPSVLHLGDGTTAYRREPSLVKGPNMARGGVNSLFKNLQIN